VVVSNAAMTSTTTTVSRRGEVQKTRASSTTKTTTTSTTARVLDEELTTATRCARLSNSIYKGANANAWVESDGFKVVKSGATGATAWCVCDDVKTNERFVVIRGAAWNQPDTDRNKLSWQIAKVWPMALKRGTPVVAHQGVLEMVDEFWGELKPHLVDGAFNGRFQFTGHSLGGSMALIIAARCRLELGIEASRVAPVHQFGSPPVLAYDRLGGGRVEGVDAGEIMRLCGFEQGSSIVRQYVLEKDLFSRMWLSADPVFSAATKTDFIGGLLDWRRDTFGEGMFTKNRFLYESVGDLYWLEYRNGEKNPVLSQHFGDEVLEKLTMDLDELTQSPWTAFRTIGDHNSQNYVDALQYLTIRSAFNPNNGDSSSSGSGNENIV